MSCVVTGLEPVILRSQLYEVPIWFRDDWLNRYYDTLAAQAHAAPATTGSSREGGDGGADTGNEQQSQVEASVDDATDSNVCSGSACNQSPRQGQQRVSEADYRFVYCGPAGSWTPLHSDVLRSYSWSANVAGRKRWVYPGPQGQWACTAIS